MSKKHFIALANMIRQHNEAKRNTWGRNAERMCFNAEQLDTLAAFCRSQNGAFMRDRWLAYINGECGPNGGEIRKPAA